MTTGNFDRTQVEQLEQFAQQNPSGYKLRVALLAVLGYAYIATIAVLLLSLLWFLRNLIVGPGASVSSDITLMIFLIVVVVLGIAGVGIYNPTGVEIKRDQAPQLFIAIDEICSKLNTPPVHRVILEDNLNAGMLQFPRLGVLGWEENFLFIGLPLMQVNSVDQLRSVLAHEIAHLAGSHSRFSNWIHHLRTIWSEHNKKSRSPLLTPFFKWYLPFFNAYTYVLSRANEYEADRHAGQITGSEHDAQSLVNLYLYTYHLQRIFWRNIYAQAKDWREPPKDLFTRMLQSLRQPLPTEKAQIWLDLALTGQTDADDTHPALAERLAAHNYIPQIPEPLTTTAAEYYLGSELPAIAAKFDQRFQKSTIPLWQQLHATAKQRASRLERFKTKAETNSFSIDELWLYAELVGKLHQEKQALQLWQNLLERQPNHAHANYHVGKILLEQGDEAGVALMEQAIALSYHYAVSGSELLLKFYRQLEQSDRATYYLQQYKEQCQKFEITAKARLTIKEEDQFLPHQLSEFMQRQLHEHLALYPEIARAYLVQKQPQLLPEQPLYLLVLVRRIARSLQSPQSTDLQSSDPRVSFDRYDQLVAILSQTIDFPAELKIEVLAETQSQKLWQMIKRVDQSLLYRV
ncbi:peptidase M48 Ste24p [Thalassoporum mexicanum PCC 7367]|uniref:M48 family metallopeptidase n=1 Tax=Thalassoporum mexicanum TaxID=3457544 RepID=UPI00029FC434|nr:M48 family metallopeptidase [Pseudanabaena sp. PCC 7367]AFY69678.1 peptidase M48 Ste24p [Pseudanabaena sp. PCC 7367]